MLETSYAFLLSLTIIAAGYLLKRIGFWGPDDGKTLTKVILNLTLPALILRTIIEIELTPSYALLPVICVVWSALVVALALLLFRRRPPAERAVIAMGSVGYNIGLFAYPLVNAIWGLAGLQYLAMFDIGSAFTNFGISFTLAAILSARARNEQADLRFADVAVLPLKSVPLMTYFVALALNLLGASLPRFIDDLLAVFAQANQVLVLLLLGLFLSFVFDRGQVRDILRVFAIRYVLGIAAGLALFFALPFDFLYRAVVLVAMILPVSMAVVPFSVKFGFDEKLAGALVNLSIVVSFVVMWLLVVLLPAA
jgi:hypothetical protein